MQLNKPTILDLFSGTESLYQPALDLGFDYFSIDNEARFSPDILVDIFTLSASDIPVRPDIVWASPPCTFFSVASIGKHWNKDHTPKTENAKYGMKLVQHTLKLIDELNPRFYFMENPRGKLRKLDVVSHLPIRHTVTYCQYGDTRMKPTDIWTDNPNWTPRPMCKNGDPCHVAAPRGSKSGTQGLASTDERGKVPYNLLYEILNSCNIELSL